MQQQAIQATEQDGIVFLDEIDKIVSSHDKAYSASFRPILNNGLQGVEASMGGVFDPLPALQHTKAPTACAAFCAC